MQLSSPRGLESCNPGRQSPNEYHQSLRIREFLTISHVSMCFPLVCSGFRRPGLLLSSPRGPDNCDPVALYISLSRSVTLPPSPCNLSHLSKATLWSVAATGVPRELGKRSHFTKVAQGVRAGLAGQVLGPVWAVKLMLRTGPCTIRSESARHVATVRDGSDSDDDELSTHSRSIKGTGPLVEQGIRHRHVANGAGDQHRGHAPGVAVLQQGQGLLRIYDNLKRLCCRFKFPGGCWPHSTNHNPDYQNQSTPTKPRPRTSPHQSPVSKPHSEIIEPTNTWCKKRQTTLSLSFEKNLVTDDVQPHLVIIGLVATFDGLPCDEVQDGAPLQEGMVVWNHAPRPGPRLHHRHGDGLVPPRSILPG